MALIGRLHPLLIHFPIALLIVAVAAEAVATMTGRRRWRDIGLANARGGALSALVAVAAGWLLASAPEMGTTAILEWHKWLGTTSALFAVTAALATSSGCSESTHVRMYRIALLGAGTLVAVAGHLGGLMVWGNVLRP
ncbi:MAG TPA: DUF2231 domain-containing protein [Vicinamibacterales bacterium]|nr:DUF2231 domain-containing protein [Vicinamibacterales bacterium]